MYANYHTHTYLCKHASGSPEEYVEQAICAGVKLLGFSDHVPYPFSKKDYKSTFRMEIEDTSEYIRMISELREHYRGVIDIFIGYEAEYYPKEFAAMLEHIAKFGCDYLILGQHCFNNEYDGTGTGWKSDDSSLMKKYADQVIEAIRTKKFSYIAHPDIINCQCDASLYKYEASRICLETKKYGLPLEINMLGLEEGRNYPNELFWSVAAEIGNAVVIGCDAHRPDALNNPEIEAAALKFAARFGLKPVETVNLIKP